MNQFHLKSCVKCGGDLAMDEGDWLCLQCGSYYYVGLYRHNRTTLSRTPQDQSQSTEVEMARRPDGSKTALKEAPCASGMPSVHLETVSA